jgi:hypothetical protein
MTHESFVPEFSAKYDGRTVEVCSQCPEFAEGKIAVRRVKKGGARADIQLVSLTDTKLQAHPEHTGRLAILRQKHKRLAGHA